MPRLGERAAQVAPDVRVRDGDQQFGSLAQRLAEQL
jgi:hypothetical protein